MLSVKNTEQSQAMKKSLAELKRQVYQNGRGLNIYALINRLEKYRGNSIPDSAIQLLCEEYLKRKDKVVSPFPWAVTVLKLKADEINAKREMEQSNRFKKDTNTKLLRELFK